MLPRACKCCPTKAGIEFHSICSKTEELPKMGCHKPQRESFSHCTQKQSQSDPLTKRLVVLTDFTTLDLLPKHVTKHPTFNTVPPRLVLGGISASFVAARLQRWLRRWFFPRFPRLERRRGRERAKVVCKVVTEIPGHLVPETCGLRPVRLVKTVALPPCLQGGKAPEANCIREVRLFPLL